MNSVPVDPRWPKILSLSVHEFRTPLTVVAGYIRMLLKDRAGALSDQQRRLLEEAEKSCTRLSALLTETSDLANLEAGTVTLKMSPIDLRALLAETIASLPPMPDREVHIELTTGNTSATVLADAVRLKIALGSLLTALRRELVTSTQLLVHEWVGDYDGAPASWIAVGAAEALPAIASTPEALATFDEWRGGCGLSLPVARRIINAHGGAVWSLVEGTRAAAVLVLPHA